MKIVEKKTFDYIAFEKIEPGEVFKTFSGKYLLKVEGFGMLNAISLDNGEANLFYDHEKVIPVNATLVIGED